MYSPDQQGEYTLEAAALEGALHFSTQWLIDVLMTEALNV